MHQVCCLVHATAYVLSTKLSLHEGLSITQIWVSLLTVCRDLQKVDAAGVNYWLGCPGLLLHSFL